jgi:ATP-binding cassette subfamily B protein
VSARRARIAESIRLARTLTTLGFSAAPRLMCVALLITIGGAICGSCYPIGFKLVIDAAARHDGGEIVFGGALVAVLFTGAYLFGVTGANANGLLTDRANLLLGVRIGELLANAPRLEHFERQEHLRRIDQLRDNRRMLAGAPRQLLGMLQSAIRGAVTVALLATVYLPVLLVPLFALAPGWADKRASRLQQQSDDDLAQDRRLLEDLFRLATTAGPARELRTYGITDSVSTRHAELSEQLRRRSVRAALRSAAWEAAGWGLFAVGFVGAIVVLVLRAAHGEVSPGQVVMSVSLLRRTQRTVSSSTDTAGALSTSSRTARQLLWLTDYVDDQSAATTAASTPARLAEGISLHGVSFTYPNATEATLHEIDLELPAGATVAIVGENGAGKTTLMKLLCGMYRPSHGRIAVNEVDLAELDPTAWRTRITATFQDYVQFNLIARQSVGVGDLESIDDDEVVMAALHRAGARELVDELPDGLGTRVGNRFTGGRELSGGQWQRLALARGLMRPEPLLIVLDEPTASLDAPTEAALFARYAQAADRGAAATGAITLLITHRFSTVHSADLIVVLERGRVAEVGSHRELIAIGGLYAELYQLQASAYLQPS